MKLPSILGDFHLLTQDPGSRRGLYAYQCHLHDEGRGAVAVFRRAEGDEAELVPELRKQEVKYVIF